MLQSMGMHHCLATGAHPGETLTAWRGDMLVKLLGQLSGIHKLPTYRVAERMMPGSHRAEFKMPWQRA